ncbi:MAG: 4a-hydroxytetrahydrobiopterin dehydratase [Alphaproteobacteria bacterium]|nr:MAG: 4a-hydroxytetrahydrobiopterin dehydratase [Alphaproteobacteria bacterium]
MADKMDARQIKEALASLPGWRLNEAYTGIKGDKSPHDAIERAFDFPDFSAAWGFMNRCALEAEKGDHHPDWSNCYNQVVVRLTTHHCGGVSELDFALARRMNAFCNQR